MPAVPAIDPWQRIVAVRAYQHGLSVRGQGSTLGKGLVRPQFPGPGDTWTLRDDDPAAGNIVWTGSTPRHTVAYHGPAGRYWGMLRRTISGVADVVPWRQWFAHNGQQINGPGTNPATYRFILGACYRRYPDLPAAITAYAGIGTGELTFATPPTGPTVTTGDWTVRCIVPGAAALFDVLDPTGMSRGVASLGALFDGPLRFTITAGDTAFVQGDEWTVAAESQDQFVVLAQTLGIEDGAVPDLLYRRAVDGGQTDWRLLATLAAPAGALYPAPQPWFFNASGTQARTCRGTASGVLELIVDVDAGTVSSEAHVLTPITVSVSASGAEPAPYTLTISTANGGHESCVVAVDFEGDTRVTWAIEVTASQSGTQDYNDTLGDFQLYSADVATTVSADLVYNAGATRLAVMRYSAQASMSSGGDFSGSTRNVVAQTIVHMGDPAGQVRAWVEADVAETMTGVGGTDRSGTATGRTYNNGVLVGTETASGGDAGAMIDMDAGIASSGTGVTGGYGVAGNYDLVTRASIHGDVTDWRIAGIVAEHGPGWSAGVLAAFGLEAAGVTFTDSEFARRFARTARDTRGNYLSALNVPTWNTGWLFIPRFATGIGGAPAFFTGSASGWDLRTGGPDSLTPAIVASLSGYADPDVWDVGAF